MTIFYGLVIYALLAIIGYLLVEFVDLWPFRNSPLVFRILVVTPVLVLLPLAFLVDAPSFARRFWRYLKARFADLRERFKAYMDGAS